VAVRWWLWTSLVLACARAAPTPFEPCDVKEASCQVQTFLAVEERRGQLWDPWAAPPPVYVITRDDLRRILATGAQGFNLWTLPLQELGLLAGNVDVARADDLWRLDNGLAFYWSRDKLVTLIGERLPPGDIGATATLAHEYVHAAQDREVGIAFPPGLGTDLQIVRTSLIEGEAEFFGALARLEMEGSDPAAFDWNTHYRGWLTSERNDTIHVTSPHTHVRLALPYPLGGGFLARAWLRAGAAGINRAFLDPPRSTLELMLASEDQPGHVPRAAPCVLAPDRARFRPIDVDTLGAALFYAFLVRLTDREADSWQSALTWRGDQLWLAQNAVTGTLTTLWHIRAPGFAASPLGPLLSASAGPPLVEGDDVFFWSEDDPDLAQVIRHTLVCP
jgi:hypothetical protein